MTKMLTFVGKCEKGLTIKAASLKITAIS